MNDREFKIRLNNFFFFYEMIAKMSGNKGGEKAKIRKERKKDKPLATAYFTFVITYIEAKITTQLD